MIIPSLLNGLTGDHEISQIDLVPTALFARPNLLTRDPHLGKYDSIKDVYKPKIMNNALGIDSSRRVIMCRNDLRTKVGKAGKEKATIKPILNGVGRNTKSVFRTAMTLPILVPSDSQDASKLSRF